MDKETRLDKLLTWFKNNRVFSVAMLVGIGIVGASKLITSISSLVTIGEQLFSTKSPPAAHSDDSVFDAPASNEAIPPPRGKVRSIALEVLRFGAAGTGPGYLDGPARISISPQGQLALSDSGDAGRIQRFGLDGRFVSQWFAKDRNHGSASLDALAIDAQGGATLYVGQVWDLHGYDLNTGNDLGKLERYEGAGSLETLAPDPRGGAVALWTRSYTSTLDLVRYEHGAKSAHLIKRDVLKRHVKERFPSPQIAVDGSGNIYILVEYEAVLLKYSEDGEFLDRMGEYGEGTGQWTNPSQIAIDGQGHIAVGNENGIDVLSAKGHHVGEFKSNCPGRPLNALSLAFDLKDFLYVLCDDVVIKYRLNIP